MDIEDYKYRTELHVHTTPASACAHVDAKTLVELYAKMGYHSLVLTNHFMHNMPFVENKEQCIENYLADYELAVETAKEYGLNVILGCELRFTENLNDYLIFGMDKDFLDYAYDRFELGIEEFSKEFRSEDHVIIQAHPFRDKMREVPPECIDGIETFNMQPNHKGRIGLALKYAKAHNMLHIAGTDCHHLGHEGLSALRTKTEMKTSHDIAKVLRSGDFLLEVGDCVVLP